MKTYKVTITETLEKTIEVKASSRCEAEEIVESRYNNSDYILDADNFAGVTFTATPLQKDRGLER